MNSDQAAAGFESDLPLLLLPLPLPVSPSHFYLTHSPGPPPQGIPEDPNVLWRKAVHLWNDGYLLGVAWRQAPEGKAGPNGEPPGYFGLISGGSQP